MRATETKRDEIWDVALTLAASGGKHATGDIERATHETISRRTILDCMDSMETAGWLAMRDRGPHGMEFWLPARIEIDDDREDIMRPSGIVATEQDDSAVDSTPDSE